MSWETIMRIPHGPTSLPRQDGILEKVVIEWKYSSCFFVTAKNCEKWRRGECTVLEEKIQLFALYSSYFHKSFQRPWNLIFSGNFSHHTDENMKPFWSILKRRRKSLFSDIALPYILLLTCPLKFLTPSNLFAPKLGFHWRYDFL